MFGLAGEVEEVRLKMDKDDPERCKGFGFVRFNTEEAAANAVSELNRVEVCGREVRAGGQRRLMAAPRGRCGSGA